MNPKTVVHHAVEIYQRPGVRGRSEAVAWAIRVGISCRCRRAERHRQLPGKASPCGKASP